MISSLWDLTRNGFMMKKQHGKHHQIHKLKRKAFKIWSQTVRRDRQCEICGIKHGEPTKNGKPAILNAHHIVGRHNLALAWDLKNGISLCSYCHKFSKTGPHQGGIIFSEWFRVNHPEEYAYLLEHHMDNVDITLEHMLEVIKNLEEKSNGTKK